MKSFLVVDELKSGRLVPVLTEFLHAEHPINAIYPHRHHLSAKVRSFIDLLVKRFHEDPAWADPCRACLARPADANIGIGQASPLTPAQRAPAIGFLPRRSVPANGA